MRQLKNLNNMREIKFRVWDIVLKKKMFYPSTELEPSETEHGSSILCCYYDHKEWSGFTLNVNYQQYTGVNDKNGKEVYEGDLLKISWNNIPEYIDEVCWVPQTLTWYPAGVLTAGYRLGYSFEVIGNIFQNPEIIPRQSLKTRIQST